MLARAIKQLSVDLYSKEIHFVMELIQNADDNEYTVKEPFIRFIIEQDKILVQNNENGFSEKHVQALCDVANSTKTKKMGYIGEKGIGFKSVFRISHTPQIFSNGFRFELRGNDKEFPLSYIVPYWIENVPNYVDLGLTNIVLPLREDISEDFLKNLKKLIQL
jgi:HSP90 family molecular chaperone